MADDEAIRGILADRNLRFPDHPRLVPDLHVFAMPDGLGIQFRGGPFPTVLRGPKAQTTLECLLPLLDGSRTVDMILAALPAEIAAETVLRTLLLLHQKGLLAGASQQAEREQTRDASQLLFWGRHIDITRNARNAEELNRRIETAHLILVGTGLFGTLVYEALVRTGFSAISVAAWNDDGNLAEIARGEPAPAREVLHAPTTEIDDVAAWVQARIAHADLLIVAVRNASTILGRSLNRICLDSAVPWLWSNDSGSQMEIGPYIVPHDSGCYRCLELRRSSARADAVEEHLYHQELSKERPAATVAPLGEAFPFAMVAAGLVASEVCRGISAIAVPSLIGQVMTLSPVTGEMERHRFMRVPRCPECARQNAPARSVDAG